MTEPQDAKVLLFDIENTPNISYTWGKWDQNVQKFKKEWWVLCYGWKWLGQPAKVVAQPDFDDYEHDRSDDRKVMLALRDQINEADVVVAHNGNDFDWPKSRARWAINGIDPPKPVRVIDTLLVARRKFRFNDNSLGGLGETLGLGTKGSSGGIETWIKCMDGDRNAWDQMTHYCLRDVELLEDVYLRLRPFIDNHPNLALMSGRPEVCPRCGSGRGMIVRGRKFHGVTASVTYQCKNCGGYVNQRLSDKDTPRPAYKA